MSFTQDQLKQGYSVECPDCHASVNGSCYDQIGASGWPMPVRVAHTRDRAYDMPHPRRVYYAEGFFAGMAEMAQIIVATIQREAR